MRRDVATGMDARSVNQKSYAAPSRDVNVVEAQPQNERQDSRDNPLHRLGAKRS